MAVLRPSAVLPVGSNIEAVRDDRVPRARAPIAPLPAPRVRGATHCVTAGGLLARCWPATFGPLAAVADALDAHTTAVGLTIVALFAAALVAARFAPACQPSYASLV